MKTSLQLEITYEQILSLIRQLPNQEKIKLTKELEKEVIESKLSQLLQTFKTDELDITTIDEEVEKVRQELYEKRKR
jgi:SMC interacting uncharacterized protein involved in chromosome segregation